jgi:hypothetical protein
MKLLDHSLFHAPRAMRMLALVGLLMSLLWGCGGVGTGGTGDYTESSVSGFGSIIVGGVEFDDSNARVLDDDGAVVQRNGNELRLGMTLEVGGSGAVTAGAQPSAGTFQIATAVLGPVDTVDAGAKTLTVLGQQVQVSASTVFGSPLRGGLSALRLGDVVAIYAYPDANSARYLATRIETAPGAPAYRLRGVVSALDTATRSLRIGGASVSYANASSVPPTLVNGQMVNLRLPARSDGSMLVADAFGEAALRPSDAASALVDGLVTSFASPSSFSVNGIPVDASQATLVTSQASLALGVFVSVQGRISGGTLIATQVTLLTQSDIDARVFQVTGVVSGWDAAAKTFTVRNVEVDYSAAAFVNGTPAGLANGVAVRVEGALSADGSQIRATQVTLR